jgi:hypothetical protein
MIAPQRLGGALGTLRPRSGRRAVMLIDQRGITAGGARAIGLAEGCGERAQRRLAAPQRQLADRQRPSGVLGLARRRPDDLPYRR